MMPATRKSRPASRRQQSGAVLYIALIMLILLALIGIVGMQVSTLQERMASNYRAVNLSFQNAEGLTRSTECALEDLTNRTTTAGCTAIVAGDVNQNCEDGFDPGKWAQGRALADKKVVNARLIGPCISGNSSLALGGVVNEDPNPIYQVTTYMTDDDNNPTAASAIDTIFRP